MIADPIGAIISFLSNESAVSAFVSTRIYGTELPRAEAENMPRKSLVIQPSGGLGDTGGYADLGTQRFDVFSYGETPYQADRLRREVYQSLKRLRRRVIASVLLFSVTPAGGLLTMRDPDADWPIAWQSFSLMYGEVEVA